MFVLNVKATWLFISTKCQRCCHTSLESLFTKYGTCYLNDIHKVSPFVEKKVLWEEHTTRHRRDIGIGIKSNMIIESALINYAKGPGRLIGITLQQRSFKNWTYSFHFSNQLLHNLDEMYDRKLREVTVYKE